MAKFYLHKLALNRGGYDECGSYWGVGQPLWECFDEDSSYLVYVRANNRADAKERAIDELWTKHAVRDENVTFFK